MSFSFIRHWGEKMLVNLQVQNLASSVSVCLEYIDQVA